jgi:hypothetical protein
MATKKVLKEYTVIGFYVDNNEVFMDWFKAATPQGACNKAKAKRKNLDTGIVEVIEGKHKGCLLNEAVVY